MNALRFWRRWFWPGHSGAGSLLPACAVAVVGAWIAAVPAMAAAAETEPVPTTIESRQLDMRSTDTETTFVFEGLVRVVATNLELTCDRLEVVALRSDEEPDALGELGQFKSLIATGRVRIVQGDRIATCERAEVLPGEEKITLTGRPMVRDRESTATGDRMVLYRGERRAVIESGAEGPVRITLPPIRDLGFRDEAPAGPPVPEKPAVP
jgi:lipopolysaccharide export system protein LptA